MAGTKRPSFLKAQKEKQREARAREKREAKQQKRARAAELRAAGATTPEFAPPATETETDSPEFRGS